MRRYPVKEDMARQLNNIFTYHSPFGDQPQRYVMLRDKAKELAHLIVQFTCPSREQSLAITKLEEAIFFANAAIARNEPNDFMTIEDEVVSIENEAENNDQLKVGTLKDNL